MSEEKRVLPTFPDLPEHPLGAEAERDFYRELQAQVFAWAEYNFGEGTGKEHRQVLGMIEELGELDEQLVALDQVIETRDSFLRDEPTTDFDARHRTWLRQEEDAVCTQAMDACADFVIYAAHYCAKRGWDLASIVLEPVRGFTPSFMSVTRWLSHCHLKGEQGIRGGFSEKDARMREAIAAGFQLARSACAERLPWALTLAVRRTWHAVRRRDWVNHPSDAATKVEEGVS